MLNSSTNPIRRAGAAGQAGVQQEALQAGWRCGAAAAQDIPFVRKGGRRPRQGRPAAAAASASWRPAEKGGGGGGGSVDGPSPSCMGASEACTSYCLWMLQRHISVPNGIAAADGQA